MLRKIIKEIMIHFTFWITIYKDNFSRGFHLSRVHSTHNIKDKNKWNASGALQLYFSYTIPKASDSLSFIFSNAYCSKKFRTSATSWKSETMKKSSIIWLIDRNKSYLTQNIRHISPTPRCETHLSVTFDPRCDWYVIMSININNTQQIVRR